MPAKKKTTRRNTKKELQKKAATRKMIAFFVGLLLILFALARLGIVGILLYNIVRLFIGSLAIILLLLVAAIMILSVFRKQFLKENKRIIPAIILTFIGLMFVFQIRLHQGLNETFHLIWSDLTAGRVIHFVGSGLIGAIITEPAKALFSVIGVYIIAAVLWLVAIYLMIPGLFPKMREDLHQRLAKWKEKRAEKVEAKKAVKALKKLEEEKEIPEPQTILPEAENSLFTSAPVEIPINIPEAPFEENENPVLEENPVDDEPVNFMNTNNYNGNYKLPTIDLLAEVPVKNQSGERENVRKNIGILEETFKSFGIGANVESAVVGPSITKYEIKLATGTKVSRVVNLSDDLALALAAKDIRIEAPIPGKSLVGVEIPNAEVAMVGFREMWEAGKTNPSKLLEIPLGKSLDGGIRTFDLTRMPHLLVAGSTGSGKSVAVNGIITSILMKALPSQVKFLMVDPKMVELSVYNDIPHLLIPVVTNPRKASRALQKVVDQMEERYELFSRYGVRNIAGYNEKVQRYNAESDEKMLELPLIVVIVDELADLMMVASKEVEDAIIRLGQKARAAGIHMILATQRPSVDVISGLIKANVPSRIAFAVSSGTDSRTILDTNGAEKLLGRGDMLFKPIDENHPVRLQGAFLSDDDVEAVVTFIKDQSEAQYDESFDPGEVDENQVGTGASNTGSGDPLFEEARNMVIIAQKASTAQLQRALKVGFNRASDLMNELEAQGIVGPAKGTTPRKVLVSPDGEFIGGVEE
ncbi:DNA translocase FtsK [Lactococcus cremoris]|uniref:DNA translocase FtsK n=1 Tax=Lactococcus lactis subsp. cremoris (strain MG1363) TaxID=416870 RepID=FTSK_LACLM|nr:DNA translocase FtsK [Lactococcus cremoris]A2RJB8.1 RecName: Full=DNA translocase FtsK [Lactococcus cremoris subsp. cremoris MG1363]ADJ59786.1 DNA translocase ftsK [Lactococcus cremoris subsp. cremoris NZ9000]KZK49568.1 Cell division protein FtsK [Lactococcus cremoris]MCT4436230.1 DNA translocase FtsK [Lactococcus cremoris]MCT4446488.1 DNA translocase FtsK [Lactococcus cremoris]MCZ7688739.1 DNA translocase FtsK [Lactococcus cremoris]